MRTLHFTILLLLFFIACKEQEKKTAVDVKELPDYPSASAIESFRNRIYIMGDDANYMLITDSALNNIDSIPFFSHAEKRIPKSIKADLESITTTAEGKLLVVGSGSLSPYRNMAWLIDPVTKQKDSITLDTFYYRLRSYNIHELNIEGLVSMRGATIFSNRGNRSYPKNHLIFTSEQFWKQQTEAKINTALIGFNSDSSSFSGVSGMDYSPKTDALILTVSTEDTRNSLEDGAIGKSYLWIVNNISAKRKWKAINPDRIIDLDKMDPVFKGEKIESVCILKETSDKFYLLLASDNDNGSSTLFKLVVSKD